ncbi:MAG: hypothetical protein ACR2NY_04645 [Alphaproteobacteria bacterium]
MVKSTRQGFDEIVLILPMKNFCDDRKLQAKIARAIDVSPSQDRFLFDMAMKGVVAHLLPIKQPLAHIFCQNLFLPSFTTKPYLKPYYQTSHIDEKSHMPLKTNYYDVVVDFMLWHYYGERHDILQQYYDALKLGGFFQTVFLGGDSFLELERSFLHADMMINNSATMRFFPRQQMADAIAALAQFSDIVADSDKITITFQDIKKLLQDARGMALTNSLISLSSYFSCPKILQKTIDYWLAQNPAPLAFNVELFYLHAVKTK